MKLEDWDVVNSFLSYYGEMGAKCQSIRKFHEAKLGKVDITLFSPSEKNSTFSLYIEDDDICLVAFFDRESFYLPNFRDIIKKMMSAELKADDLQFDGLESFPRSNLIFIKV
jgi:hypothetical protein